jgi:predicted transcriptional regulator
MSLKKLVNKTIPYLEPYDTCKKAVEIMTAFKVSNLAVANSADKMYIGLISEDDIVDFAPKMPIMETNCLKRLSVSEDKHILEVLDIVSSMRISLLPVVDAKGKYIGALTYKNIIERMAEETSASIKGGIIEIETDTKNFSPALITGISENNSLKVMSLLTRPKDIKTMRAIIKLNGQDTTSVIQGLERHGYNVKNVYQGDSKYSEMLEERYNALLSYMNV